MDPDFEKYKKWQFCSNTSCSFYGQQMADNIGIKSKKNRQVYCKGCKETRVITKDTFFYHLKTPVSVILEVLLIISEGMSVNAIRRSKGICAETLNAWVLKAAKHVKEITVHPEYEMRLTQCQIDEFWSFIYKKKRSFGKMR